MIFSISLARIYTANAENKDWTNTTNEMEQCPAAVEYKKCWDNIHEVYRWVEGKDADWPPRPVLRFNVGDRVSCRVGPHPVTGKL